jgi:D-tyrosyl-tRNA(Tyr) deacylase
MIALLQRVTQASVMVDAAEVGAIDAGLLALIGVQRGDGEAEAERLLERILGYRMFGDGKGRMNLSVTEIHGGLLLVPQFTLPADTRKGMRPSFSSAAHPDTSRALFDHLVAAAEAAHAPVATGRFGERMSVSLVNEGPVTFWLEVTPPAMSS